MTQNRPKIPVVVCICNAAEDEEHRQRLVKHLAGAVSAGIVSLVDDTKIQAGSDRRRATLDNIDSAGIVLFLVSADFIGSDFCRSVQLARAIQRHGAGKTRLVPIIVHDVDWDAMPFSGLNPLPPDGRPVATWDDPETA